MTGALLRRRPTELPREVWVLAAVAFAVAVGFGIAAPVVPVFAREFGVGQTAAGLVISAFAFMRLVSGPAGGWVVGRLGERATIAYGLWIVAASNLLTALAQNFEQMLVLRGLGGVGSTMFTVAGTSLLLRSVPASRRGRANGVYWGAFLAGAVGGPLFGGLFATVSLRLPFFVYAGTLAVAALIGLRWLPRVDPTAIADSSPTTTFRQALRDRTYRAALAVNAGTGWVIFGVRASLVPLFVVEAMGRGPLWTGVGLLLGSLTQVATIYPAGRLTDSLGRRPVTVGGTAFAAAACLVLAATEAETAFLAAMVLFGVAASALSTAPAAAVGDVVAGRGGSTIAAFGMASDVGAVLGPPIAGALAEHVSYGAAFASTAAVAGACLLVAARMPEPARS